MNAGVLSYRLCDRGLDCGDCPLDQALRNAPAHRDRAPAPAGSRLPRGLFFHPGHTWVRLLADGHFEVGIDDLARRLVGEPSKVEAPAAGEHLLADAPAFAVTGDPGRVAFTAPFDGTVTETNPALAADPHGLEDMPYDAGWILRARADDPSAALAALRSGDEAARWMTAEEARVKELVEVAAGTATLADGGRLDRSLLAALPRDAAERVLVRVLGTI
jgi:glycine cleavage system H lipoate-binding protein